LSTRPAKRSSVPSGSSTASAAARVNPPSKTDSRANNALGLVERRVAPVDHGPQRALPGHRGPRAGREQLEPVVDPAGDLRDVEVPRAGRRELNGQRQPVETPADLRDDLAGIRGRDRPTGPGPFPEQRHGGIECQRSHREQHFSRDGQAFPARRQDPEVGCEIEQQRDERRDLLDQVLAVVDDQRRLAAGEEPADPVDEVDAVARQHGVVEPDSLADRFATPPAVSGARSTQQTPSASLPCRISATSSASRLLPTPPGPTSVVRPGPSTSVPSSVSRPMQAVLGRGKRREGAPTTGTGTASAGSWVSSARSRSRSCGPGSTPSSSANVRRTCW
jgi:hypothetical protein